MLHFRSFLSEILTEFCSDPCCRPIEPLCRAWTQAAQAQASRTIPRLFFHGRKMPRCVLSRQIQCYWSHRVICLGCFAITTVFSNAQSVVLCGSCASVLCQPTGGRARLTEGMSSNYMFCHALTWIFRRLLIPTEELDTSLHSSSLVEIVQAGWSYTALYHYSSPPKSMVTTTLR